MKSTGVVRKVDELGRIVIPMELRRTLGIDVGDGIEIFVDKDRIMLRRYEPSCIFCGNANQTVIFKGKLVCADCIVEMPDQKDMGA